MRLTGVVFLLGQFSGCPNSSFSKPVSSRISSGESEAYV